MSPTQPRFKKPKSPCQPAGEIIHILLLRIEGYMTEGYDMGRTIKSAPLWGPVANLLYRPALHFYRLVFAIAALAF